MTVALVTWPTIPWILGSGMTAVGQPGTGSAGPLWHDPPPQVSPVVQRLPSEQGVPLGCLASLGQSFVVPLQVSARSQSPAAARQTVPLSATASAGQVRDDPSHVSATSQAPEPARQMNPAATGPHV